MSRAVLLVSHPFPFESHVNQSPAGRSGRNRVRERQALSRELPILFALLATAAA